MSVDGAGPSDIAEKLRQHCRAREAKVLQTSSPLLPWQSAPPARSLSNQRVLSSKLLSRLCCEHLIQKFLKFIKLFNQAAACVPHIIRTGVNVAVVLHCCAPNNTDPIERGALGGHNPDKVKIIQGNSVCIACVNGTKF
jgi:hypothetical protein